MNDGGKVKMVTFHRKIPRLTSRRNVVEALYAFVVTSSVDHTPSMFPGDNGPCVLEFAGALLVRDRIWSSHKIDV